MTGHNGVKCCREVFSSPCFLDFQAHLDGGFWGTVLEYEDDHCCLVSRLRILGHSFSAFICPHGEIFKGRRETVYLP